jgi:hypothetical protein
MLLLLPLPLLSLSMVSLLLACGAYRLKSQSPPLVSHVIFMGDGDLTWKMRVVSAPKATTTVLYCAPRKETAIWGHDTRVHLAG